MEVFLVKYFYHIAVGLMGLLGTLLAFVGKIIIKKLDEGNVTLNDIDKKLILIEHTNIGLTHAGNQRDKKIETHDAFIRELYVSTEILKHQDNKKE